jgi:dTDP-4-dehydrorhamnose reductase
MKILVTGSKGQLGNHLVQNLMAKNSNDNVIGVDINNFDITDFKQADEYISDFKPDIIIHPAAYTNVEECEANQKLAYKVNAVGTQNLASIANKLDAKFVYVSTDYVFNGNIDKHYNEFDKINPESVYGKSKVAGEEITKSLTKKFFIVRVAWLYGLIGSNFVKTIIRIAKEKGHLDVVNDQTGSPTYAKDVAEVIVRLIETENYGIYHATNEGECTWFDFAKKIVELSNIDAVVEPTTTEKISRLAPRPVYSVLDNMMLELVLDYKMRHWEDALREYISELGWGSCRI